MLCSGRRGSSGSLARLVGSLARLVRLHDLNRLQKRIGGELPRTVCNVCSLYGAAVWSLKKPSKDVSLLQGASLQENLRELCATPPNAEETGCVE